MAARKSSRLALPKVADEMRRWSEMLRTEAERWPKVSSRPMFSMTALYRDSAIFAALPRTRALGSAYSIAFKLPDAARYCTKLDADIRIRRDRPGARWISFELSGGADLRDARRWLEIAYEQARSKARKG